MYFQTSQRYLSILHICTFMHLRLITKKKPCKNCMKCKVENQNAINFLSFVNLKDQHLLSELLTVSFIGLHKSIFFKRRHIERWY